MSQSCIDKALRTQDCIGETPRTGGNGILSGAGFLISRDVLSERNTATGTNATQPAPTSGFGGLLCWRVRCCSAAGRRNHADKACALGSRLVGSSAVWRCGRRRSRQLLRWRLGCWRWRRLVGLLLLLGCLRCQGRKNSRHCACDLSLQRRLRLASTRRWGVERTPAR